MFKITTSFALLLLVAGTSLLACNEDPASKEAAGIAAEPRPVLVAPVVLGEGIGTMRFSSVVRARHRATLAFAVPGRIARRPVQVGDRVTKGQLLARLDSGLYKNARSGAKAGLEEAVSKRAQLARDRQRVKTLLRGKAASREELEKVSAALESVEARVTGAGAQVSEANRLMADTRILAPYDGTVTAVFLERGEYAQPGLPILAIMGADQLEVEVELPESALASLSVGDPVDVALPILQISGLSGTIQSISYSTSIGRLFPVIVALDKNTALMPGVTAELHLQRKGNAAFALPIGAIVDPSGNGAYVYRVIDGHAERVPVRPLQLVGPLVLLEGELAVNDSIVVAGHSNVVPGQAVEARALSSSPLHSNLKASRAQNGQAR